MGTTPVTWPKKIVYAEPIRDFTEIQRSSPFDNPVFANAVNNTPPGDEKPSPFTWLRYGCIGGSTVCQGTNDEDENGNPKNWNQTDTQYCTSANDRRPGIIAVPNCNAQSRGLTLGTNPNTLKYVGIAVGALAIVGLVIWAAKSAK